MTSVDCTNPFQIPNHSENNNYPLKRVSILIQSHASHIGYDLEIGQRICDKCRLYARNKFVQAMRQQKCKARTAKQFKQLALKGIPPIVPRVPPNRTYKMPQADSSDQNDSNEPYSQPAAHGESDNEVESEAEDIEYVEYSDEYDQDEGESSSTAINDNSNSLLKLATPNPVSELKIVNVTSLPAEKHNEIMNNDDNAMNPMDSMYNNHNNHHLKISEIISSASNTNVFGIAKKAEPANSLLTISSNKPYHAIPNKSSRKSNSKIQKMKRQMQNNFRLSGAAIQNIDDVSPSTSTSPVRKEFTDSDEHSNSKVNFKANRRKNTLTPLDCEMEFVEVSQTIIKKQAHMTDEQRMLSSQLETVKSIKNPNSDLLRKVAFLRVCVNYMMTELEGETFNFGKNITYENLKTKYNSKRMA